MYIWNTSIPFRLPHRLILSKPGAPLGTRWSQNITSATRIFTLNRLVKKKRIKSSPRLFSLRKLGTLWSFDKSRKVCHRKYLEIFDLQCSGDVSIIGIYHRPDIFLDKPAIYRSNFCFKLSQSHKLHKYFPTNIA